MLKLSRLFFGLSVLACGYSLALLVAMYWPQSGWAVLIVGVVIVKRRRSVHLTTLGSARWAGHNDLRRAGMLGAKTGLSVGHLMGRERGRKAKAILTLFRRGLGDKEACQELQAAFKKHDRGPLVRLSKSIHTAVFIPSGGGKGVSFVIPFLLSCPESCVVIDFKGENALIAARIREKAFGQRQVFLDPYRVVTHSPDSLNPFDFIDKNDPHAIDDCRDLAKNLVIRTGEEKDPHFNDAAEMWIAAVIAVVVFYGDAKEGTRSLQTVRDILSNPQKMEQAIKLLLESNLCGGLLARMGGQLTHFVDKEKASVQTTVSRHLSFLDTPAVAESTKTSTFDLRLLTSENKKLTVYFILPANHMNAQAPLLRMWTGSALSAVVKGGLQERNKTHFILDEFSALGHMESIAQAVEMYRGFGARMQFYLQSIAQLKKCFPNGQDQMLLGNTTQIFACVNDQGLPGGAGTADYVSSRCGEQTVIVPSGGTSSGTSTQWSHGGSQTSRSGGNSVNGSANWAQQQRKLLQPAEVVALSPRIAITFTPGVPPICTWLPRYYEEARLRTRPGTLAACKMLAFAALLCAFSVLLAVTVTQWALELQGEQPIWHFNQSEMFRKSQPDVPVDPSATFYRRSHVKVGRAIV